jgi:hypothetical protein
MSISIPSGTYPIASASPRAALAAWGRALWRTLAHVGELRATSALSRLAERYDESDPALARQLREAAQRGAW